MSARVVLASLALVCAGCNSTETGNPPFAPTSMGLRSSDPSIAALVPNAGAPAIEEAWIAVASIHAMEGASCDHLAADPLLSHVAGDLAVGFETDGLRESTSCGLHVTLELASGAAGAPAGLEGRALFVRGVRGDGTPFEIASEMVATGVDVRASGELVLHADGAVLVVFDVAAWLAGIDLSAIAPDGDGVVRIEPGDAMLASFETGYATSIELFADADGDGILSAAEESAGPIAMSHP